ncbi:Methylated-DNA--protein-cysteine methyltransferase [Labeo rohita]|uniref:Methylated-DNA--protein-cysteine methyltransferase n=1 Tax=Labeo rohita TaxID=84645 RepID=A0ABQ8LUE7_LABRO|nr:Methylated-DNA--protein-cysteine methyltransferase [Labeo rohita]
MFSHVPKTLIKSLEFIIRCNSFVMSDSGSCVLRDVTLCSPVGEILLKGCEKGVHTINIKLGTDKEESALPFPSFHHPLLQSDSFTAHVLWTLFKEVELGKTVSYKQLAEMTGNPKAVRAVVPCHRVLRSSGDSGSYMGGKGDDIKVWLLTHEKKVLELNASKSEKSI